MILIYIILLRNYTNKRINHEVFFQVTRLATAPQFVGNAPYFNRNNEATLLVYLFSSLNMYRIRHDVAQKHNDLVHRGRHLRLIVIVLVAKKKPR